MWNHRSQQQWMWSAHKNHCDVLAHYALHTALYRAASVPPVNMLMCIIHFNRNRKCTRNIQKAQFFILLLALLCIGCSAALLPLDDAVHFIFTRSPLLRERFFYIVCVADREHRYTHVQKGVCLSARAREHNKKYQSIKIYVKRICLFNFFIFCCFFLFIFLFLHQIRFASWLSTFCLRYTKCFST